MAYTTVGDVLYAQRLRERAGFGDSGRHALPPSMEHLQPYYDGEVFTDPTLFAERKYERRTDTDDEAIDSYVRRIILTASLDETEGQRGSASNQSQRKPINSPMSPSPKKKDKKTNRKGRKSDKTEGMYDYEVEGTPVGPVITMLQAEYRRMVIAEVESRARNIHEYYSLQWDKAQKDKMEVYADALVWKNKFSEADRSLRTAERDLIRLKAEYARTRAELDSIRENKRRRKRYAKQRKSALKECTAGSSTSDPGHMDQENDFCAPDLGIDENEEKPCISD